MNEKTFQYIGQKQIILGSLKDKRIAPGGIIRTDNAQVIENLEQRPDFEVIITKIDLFLHEDLYVHIKKLLQSENYYSAAEEALKFTKEGLTTKIGKEKATEIFSMEGADYLGIFKVDPVSGSSQENFFKAIGFLHLAVQFFRNSFTHRSASVIDKNEALQIIGLSNLAYELLMKKY